MAGEILQFGNAVESVADELGRKLLEVLEEGGEESFMQAELMIDLLLKLSEGLTPEVRGRVGELLWDQDVIQIDRRISFKEALKLLKKEDLPLSALRVIHRRCVDYLSDCPKGLWKDHVQYHVIEALLNHPNCHSDFYAPIFVVNECGATRELVLAAKNLTSEMMMAIMEVDFDKEKRMDTHWRRKLATLRIGLPDRVFDALLQDAKVNLLKDLAENKGLTDDQFLKLRDVDPARLKRQYKYFCKRLVNNESVSVELREFFKQKLIDEKGQAFLD